MSRPAAGRSPGRVWLLDAVVASALVLALHGRSLGALLGGDDPIILSHTIRHSPFRYLLEPAAWQEFNWRGFYPFYLVSFDVNYRLAGLSPLSFRLYQLFLAAAAGVLFACVLRLWGARPWAARSAAAIVLLGPVFGTVTWQLMTRCFLEGAVLLLGAACALSAGLARRSFALVAAGSTLWLAASLEKEVFVPFLLPIAIASAMAGARLLAPPVVAAAAYLAYRSWLAPYGVRVYDVDALSLGSFLSHVGDFVKGLPQALFPGSGAAGAAVLAGLLLAGLVMGPRDRRRLLLVAAAAAAAVGPVLLVSEVLSERHVLHLWIALVLWVALGVEAAPVSRWRWKAALSVAAATLIAALLLRWDVAHDGRLAADAAWSDQLCRLFLERAAPDDYVIGDANSVHPPFAAGLNALRKRSGDGREAPFFVTDVAALCRVPLSGATRLWDVRGRAMPASPSPPAELTRDVCGRIRADRPLEVRLHKRGALLEWELGPATTGTWALVFLTDDKDVGGPGIHYDVPRKGGVWVPALDRPASLFVQHVADDGGIEQSRTFSFRLDRDADFTWSR